MEKNRTKIAAEGLEDGKFWLVVERDVEAGQGGISATAMSDKEYSKMMADFDVERLGAEVLMAHRC